MFNRMKNDDGASLILALVITSGLLIMGGSLLTYAGTNVNDVHYSSEHVKAVYDSDGALKVSIDNVRNSAQFVGPCSSKTVDGVTVSCQFVTTAKSTTVTNAGSSTLGVSPAGVSLSLHPGESSDPITKTIKTSQILPTPDIMFLADMTSSMGPAITNVRNGASSIMTSVNTTTNNPQFGVAGYRDFPGESSPYHVLAGLGTAANAQSHLSLWQASGGNDFSESNLYSLTKVATTTAWRTNSSPIVVWFGDAPGHDKVCKAISGEPADITEATATAALKSAGVRVIAISVNTGPSGGLNADPTDLGADYFTKCGFPGGAANQATRITAATGGLMYTNVDPSQVASKILEGLTALKTTVAPVVACTGGAASVALSPNGAVTVNSGDTLSLSETITAGVSSTGSATCTVSFTVDGNPVAAGFIETNTISFITTTKAYFTASVGGKTVATSSVTYNGVYPGRTTNVDSWSVR